MTAAQAYQRLVSIHPFDGGNGRMSRHMMDYVLERFGLPPAALGASVDDAVFGLKVKSPQQQQEFVRKIFEGVQKSYCMVHGG
ncbi:Fic family protein [Simkania sp.]|uniref:Fic family protein n=1 Tax=Simkania sp. TaxID=34094 RepID=UPI003B52E5E9